MRTCKWHTWFAIFCDPQQAGLTLSVVLPVHWQCYLESSWRPRVRSHRYVADSQVPDCWTLISPLVTAAWTISHSLVVAHAQCKQQDGRLGAAGPPSPEYG